MKKNLLIADAAAERLAAHLTPLLDQIELYLMTEGGKITHQGNEVPIDKVNIHYGWFGRDVMFAGYGREYAVQLLKAENLEWVQSASAGLDALFFAKLAAKGIQLTNSDAQAIAIAEYVVSSVLYRFQDFEVRKQHQTNKRWQDNHFREVHNSNWMIIGYGNIGRLTGIRANAFGANVTGVKRSVTVAEGANSIITYDEIIDSLPAQDVVVLACALTDDTRNIVNETFLNKLNKNTVLVNIGRGDLVDETALLNALDNDQLDYAVLDVFHTEPLPPESRFWTHPKVLVTPHSSNRGHGTNVRGDELFLHNLNALLKKQPLRNLVNNAELVSS